MINEIIASEDIDLSSIKKENKKKENKKDEKINIEIYLEEDFLEYNPF